MESGSSFHHFVHQERITLNSDNQFAWHVHLGFSAKTMELLISFIVFSMLQLQLRNVRIPLPLQDMFFDNLTKAQAPLCLEIFIRCLVNACVQLRHLTYVQLVYSAQKACIRLAKDNVPTGHLTTILD